MLKRYLTKLKVNLNTKTKWFKVVVRLVRFSFDILTAAKLDSYTERLPVTDKLDSYTERLPVTDKLDSYTERLSVTDKLDSYTKRLP